MKALRKIAESMEIELESLAGQVKEMEKILGNIEAALTMEAPASRSTKSKPTGKKIAKKGRYKARKRQPKKGSFTDAVLRTVHESTGGVTPAQIKSQTGLDQKQIWNIINRAKRQGKIKSEKRGLYVKA
jgi:hypothetical protein